MRPRRHFNQIVISTALFLLANLNVCLAQELTLTPYNASGIYGVGEKVGWKVTLPAGKTQAGPYTYIIRKNNLHAIKMGNLNLSAGTANIEATLYEPAMVYVEVALAAGRGGGAVAGSSGRSIAVGAAVAPEKLQPSVPRPADFDIFWDSKIRMLKAIPENATLTNSASGKPDIEYATIKMDHINGTHVHGQLARPRKPGKFPALLILQWASPPYPCKNSGSRTGRLKGGSR